MTGAGLRVVRLRVPLVEAVRGVTERAVSLVCGGAGWGESSPFPGIGVDQASCDAAAEESATRPMPEARRSSVPVSALVASSDLDAAVAASVDAVASGYGTVKLKVGDDDDVARVAAVRSAVGGEIRIRLDANGAWTPREAVERLGRMSDAGIEMCEEPVRGLEGLADLRAAVEVAVAADESVRSLADAARLCEIGAADVLVLKVQACGGLWPALEWAAAASAPVVVTSMIETSVGIASGLALAAALPDLPYACGLATAGLLAWDVVADPLVARDGRLTVRRPEPDESMLAAHAVAE
jgi:o-succinylbenzoate synthase